jgi:hypothetical protein
VKHHLNNNNKAGQGGTWLSSQLCKKRKNEDHGPDLPDGKIMRPYLKNN